MKHDSLKQVRLSERAIPAVQRMAAAAVTLVFLVLGMSVQADEAAPKSGSSRPLFPALAPPPPGEYIAPPNSEDIGKYYLLSKTQTSDGLETVYVRKSPNGQTYTKSLVKCDTLQFKALGYSNVSAADIKDKVPANWSDIVPGTSRFQMVKMVCGSSSKPAP